MSVIIGQFNNFKASARKPLFRQFGLFPPDGEIGGYSFDHIAEAGVTASLREPLSGSIDGVNATFTVRRLDPIIVRNGSILTKDVDYSITSTTPTVTVTLFVVPSAGDIIRELVNV